MSVVFNKKPFDIFYILNFLLELFIFIFVCHIAFRLESMKFSPWLKKKLKKPLSFNVKVLPETCPSKRLALCSREGKKQQQTNNKKKPKETNNKLIKPEWSGLCLKTAFVFTKRKLKMHNRSVDLIRNKNLIKSIWRIKEMLTW